MTLTQLRSLRDDILQLAALHKATNVRVFGSVARGEATPDSDTDLLVSFLPGATIMDEVALWRKLCDLLQQEIDLESDDTLKPSMHERILKDTVLL